MIASKENAEKALQRIGRIRSQLVFGRSLDKPGTKKAQEGLVFIRDFLKSAKKKLPTQKAYDDQKERQKTQP